MSKVKAMHIIFYTTDKILVDYAIPPGTIVNGNLYHKKQPQMLEDGPILLHDGAGPHRAACVTQLLNDWEWEVLGHPPYSPDLSPCDFHLFAALKEPIRGQRFASLEDINAAVSNQLKVLQNNGLQEGIPKLPMRWNAVVEQLGDYVESCK